MKEKIERHDKENNRTGTLEWKKFYLSWLWKIFGSSASHLINSSAMPDKLSPSMATTCLNYFLKSKTNILQIIIILRQFVVVEWRDFF